MNRYLACSQRGSIMKATCCPGRAAMSRWWALGRQCRECYVCSRALVVGASGEQQLVVLPAPAPATTTTLCCARCVEECGHQQ